MSIKELRLSTGMTQRAFSERYKIPLQTIKQWESDKNSSSYRTPPEYVVLMLHRLVAIDFGSNTPPSNKRIHALITAAKHSRYNAAHWFRYLRKQFDGDTFILSSTEIRQLLNSDELTMFQKVILSRAAESGTPTGKYISSLNKKASTPMLNKIRKEHKYVE